jgi:hypothetical protein
MYEHSLLSIPDEVLSHIYSFISITIDLSTLMQCGAVCTDWRDVLDKDTRWQKLCVDSGWLYNGSWRKTFINGWSHNDEITSKFNNKTMEQLEKLITSKNIFWRRFGTESIAVAVQHFFKLDVSPTNSSVQLPRCEFKSIPIRSPYFIHTYMGAGCLLEEHGAPVNDPICADVFDIVQESCPMCEAKPGRWWVLYFYITDRSHDWGWNVEMQCLVCYRYLTMGWYGGV